MEDDKTPPGELESTEMARPADAVPPERIGPYRLLQKIGEGGMGEVWLAEQTRPVKRKVALKIIKKGLDSKQVVARFEAERQALAMMDHPAIAKVYDAGTTPNGRPYFAMEYVQGIPITRHCDRHKLTTAERLALFREVCDGVQHAHHKAVIHRDLKPSNVLVTIQGDRPAPKIIDFGVAKATAQKLTDETLHTQFGVVIGTPAYMSPEQADLTGQDVDTRTDVYALGVMLYELLVGALPFDMQELRKAGLEAIVRKIREEDPPRPSSRLSTLGEQSKESAKLRRTELPALRRELSGDLDWITMRALEKDRTRRYGSPNELSADLARHLRHEPVLAGPPSALYRAKKFIRRNRLGVSFAAVVALLLAGFAATMGVQAQRIARERDRANLEAQRASREADTAKRVSTFMTRLFAIPDPGESRGNEVTAREILDQGSKQIDRGLRYEPLIRARMLTTMGGTYRNLGLLDEAQSLLEQALEILEDDAGDTELMIADTLFELGFVHFQRRHFTGSSEATLKARDCWRRSLDIRRTRLPEGHLDVASVLTHLGWSLMYSPADLDEAEARAREAQEIWESADASDWRSAHNVQLLAWVAEERGDFGESLAWADLSVDMFERSRERGDYWSPLTETLGDAGWSYRSAGRLERARDLFERALEYAENLYGPDHVMAIRACVELSKTLQGLGEIEGAYAYRLRVMAFREADPELAHSYLLMGGRLQLAHLAMQLGRHEEAREQYRGAIDLFREGVDIPAPDFESSANTIEFKAIQELPELVAEAGQYEDARELFAIALALASRLPAVKASMHRDWAALLRRMGRDAEAAEHEARAAELSAEADQGQ